MLGAHLLTSEIQFGVCDGAAARRPTAAELRCKQEKKNKYNQESFRKCFSIRTCKKMGFLSVFTRRQISVRMILFCIFIILMHILLRHAAAFFKFIFH